MPTHKLFYHTASQIVVSVCEGTGIGCVGGNQVVLAEWWGR